MRCPTCRRELPGRDNPFLPFCSERCRLADLGRWLGESYRIPGDPIIERTEPGDEAEDEDE